MKQQLQAVIPFEAVSFYPFAWLDELLEVRTNPDSIFYQAPAPAERALWEAEAATEITRIYRTLREQTFGLNAPSQLRPVVGQYLEAIDELGALAWQSRNACNEESDTAALLLQVIRLLSELKARILHRYERFLPESRKARPGEAAAAAKLVCTLSGDQIGIILKAADDTKVLLSRSISLVYKTLIPYLATTHRTELSWQSVRSNSYHPGQGDKDAAISALQAMIGAIQGYE